jgi:hypothetical protein
MKAFFPGCEARVIQGYQSQYPDPIVLRIGDVLMTGRNDTQWPGWVWCTAASGKSGWVPEIYLEFCANRCCARVDYDACELTVETGERLKLMLLESGWYWAQKNKRSKGVDSGRKC